ncbi:MAG: hypothetical protein LRY55_11985, partial [Leadbetterella sp.]|nr:hypothetical protein [Leadbetterella sp.]
LTWSGYDSFPEAVEISNPDDLSLGLVLIDKPVLNEDFRGECLVSVDFGTSNTNAFLKVGENAAERVQFKFSKHLRKLTLPTWEEASEEAKRDKSERLFFVPYDDVELPIPTAVRVYGTNYPLSDYFIYFPDEPQYPGKVFTNIKWEGEAHQTDAFLRSFIFLLLIEIIDRRLTNVSFICTHPKAFSVRKESDYKGIWGRLLEEVFYKPDPQNEQTPVITANSFISFAPGGKLYDDRRKYSVNTHFGRFSLDTNLKFVYEGKASGRFFANDEVNGGGRGDLRRGAVCIDVGGGTTDYCIWFNDNIQFDTSITFAGNVATRFIHNNADLRDFLFSPQSVESLGEKEIGKVKFDSRLNFILKKRKGVLLKTWMKSVVKNPSID